TSAPVNGQDFFPSIFGNSPVKILISGKNAHTLKMYTTLVISASLPNNADPNPPMPKAKPKNNPEIIPSLPGTSSVAYTRMAEKADERITPMITDNITVHHKVTYGSNKVN